MSSYPITENTKITRLPKRGKYDKKTIYSILDEALFCTLAYELDHQPFQIPTGFCRIDNTLYIHGSIASHYMCALVDKKLPVSISVTMIDGIVLARSLFNHSANYRSVVIFSHAERITEQEKMSEIMEVFTEKMCKGRWQDVPKPTANDWKATMVIAFPIVNASAKVRVGPPMDSEKDYKLDIWAGVLPIICEKQAPIADPQLKKGTPLPHYLVR